MPDAQARIVVGDMEGLIAVEEVDAITAELLLTLRTSAVAMVEDAVRSPEIGALIVGSGDDVPVDDAGPEE